MDELLNEPLLLNTVPNPQKDLVKHRKRFARSEIEKLRAEERRLNQEDYDNKKKIMKGIPK